MCEVGVKFYILTFSSLSYIFFRFIVNSVAGVKLAEELCENPRTCLTIFASESEDEIKSILDLKEPHYLINILKVTSHINFFPQNSGRIF